MQEAQLRPTPPAKQPVMRGELCKVGTRPFLHLYGSNERKIKRSKCHRGRQATSENQTPSSTEVSECPLGSRADLALASGSDSAGDRSAFSSYQKT